MRTNAGDRWSPLRLGGTLHSPSPAGEDGGRKRKASFRLPPGEAGALAPDEGLMKVKRRTMLCPLPACPHPPLTRSPFPNGEGLVCLRRCGGSKPPPCGMRVTRGTYSLSRLFIFSHYGYLIAKKPQMQENARGFNSFSYSLVIPLLFYHVLTESARNFAKRKSFCLCRNIPATHPRRGVDFCR